jgi:hypothetical protein
MSITTWIRLDPSARDADLRASLAARVADPLWLLARQWQIGEREGEDAGSPVVAKLVGETNQLGRYRPASGAARSFDPKTIPLEALVERESAREGVKLDRRLMAEAGLHFLRLLAAQGVSSLRGSYVARYPLTALTDAELDLIDDDSRVFLQMIQGRTLDGNALYADLATTLRPVTGSPALPAQPPVSAVDTPKVIAAGLAYLQWFETLFSVPAAGDSAWSGERMAYAFAVSAKGTGGELVLKAPTYSDGRLDWYDLDLDRSGDSLGGLDSLPAPTPIQLSAQPSPVAFKGMPAHRFWEFEDAQVDLGALDVSTSDLPRLLMMEFAFLHGNDWFVMPWPLAVGTLARVTSLQVTDTFGDVKNISPSRDLDPGFTMFQPTQLGVTAQTPAAPFKDLLFMAPTIHGGLGGRLLEDVVMARDEMANLAWAIERKIEGPANRAMSRQDAFVARRRRAPLPAPPPPAPGSAVTSRRYVLQNTIPDHWLPMVPVKVPGTDAEFRFRRGLMDRPDGPPIPAQGRILEPEHALILHEEEIPRIGLRIQRHYQMARWLGGETHLWIGRRKTVSHGESSSGLRYDIAE